MGNETCTYVMTLRQIQSSQWKSHSSSMKKWHRSRSNMKTMIVFLTLMELCKLGLYPGVLHTGEYYKGLWEQWRNQVYGLRNGQMASWQCSMPHITHASAGCIYQRKILNGLSSPPYSSDLVPCNFWRFLTVKITIRGKCLESVQDAKATTSVLTKDISEKKLPELL